MYKKITLLALLFFPALVWVFFEKVKINSYRLNFYGPKNVIAPGDTLFFTLPDSIVNLPVPASCILVPIHPEYEKKQFFIQSLTEAILYKPELMQHIPICFLYPENMNIQNLHLFKEKKTDTYILGMSKSNFRRFLNYAFQGKPYYVFDYFGILLDKNRHIRGYYNFSFTDEVKRMTQEYKHLRLKEEVQQIRQDHAVEQR